MSTKFFFIIQQLFEFYYNIISLVNYKIRFSSLVYSSKLYLYYLVFGFQQTFLFVTLSYFIFAPIKTQVIKKIFQIIKLKHQQKKYLAPSIYLFSNLCYFEKLWSIKKSFDLVTLFIFTELIIISDRKLFELDKAFN